MLGPFCRPHDKLLSTFVYTFKNECGIHCSLCSVSLISVKTWTEGTYDIPFKNPYFLVTSEPNREVFFAEMQTISCFVILI